MWKTIGSILHRAVGFQRTRPSPTHQAVLISSAPRIVQCVSLMNRVATMVEVQVSVPRIWSIITKEDYLVGLQVVGLGTKMILSILVDFIIVPKPIPVRSTCISNLKTE